MSLNHLPVDDVLGSLKHSLGSNRFAVLIAPPGAGKTTRVPPALLDEPWLDNKKIIMLEPRRLAATSCAAHMAGIMGEPVGKTVGYQIRMDRKITAGTRIEIITEGILTRRIQQDPSLEGTGLVIFDEFHERNLHSDLGLALCLESAQVLRDDLRILVMSATIDSSRVAALMGNAPVVESRGKQFHVTTHYVPVLTHDQGTGALERAVAGTVEKAVKDEKGDILVFLPGIREIRQVHRRIQDMAVPGIQIRPLAGNLSEAEQKLAILPSVPGERKIVLATAIAETSITIQGIKIVIDSGLMRIPRFSPASGMTRLETVPVSKASADQRRGRAGRLEPGVCFRLWSEHVHAGLMPYSPPEILSSDLTHLALELAAWGIFNPSDLSWLDLPPAGAFRMATDLLKQLDAIDKEGRITSHGRKLSTFGIHPRLAHMIIQADQKDQGLLACMTAALLSERDFLSFPQGMIDTDIRLRLDIIDSEINHAPRENRDLHIHRGILSSVIKTTKKLQMELKIRPGTVDIHNAGRILAFAYPERISKKRNHQARHFLMASGNGAILPEHDPLSGSEYIVAAVLDGKPGNALIFMAAPYSLSELTADFGHLFKTGIRVDWDHKSLSVISREQTCYEKLVISERPGTDIHPGTTCEMLLKGIKKQGILCLPWTPKLRSLQQRSVFLKSKALFPDLPDLSDASLESTLEQWLEPFLTGITSIGEIKTEMLESAFSVLLPWDLQQRIERFAPSHILVPSQYRVPLSYGSETVIFDAPVIRVRLQEMFGLNETPTVANGRIPITLHLLSPAQRLVQITNDLKSFWENTYPEVKKDLMGRYPKHYWPDDPLLAIPTRSVKPRKN